MIHSQKFPQFPGVLYYLPPDELSRLLAPLSDLPPELKELADEALEDIFKAGIADEKTLTDFALLVEAIKDYRDLKDYDS